MSKIIGVSQLKHITILYEEDVYELACLLLKIETAKEKDNKDSSRPTVYGLFRKYAELARLNETTLIAIAEQNNLPLQAVVNYDNMKWPQPIKKIK